MTDSNTSKETLFVDPDTDDLDLFNDLLHGRAEVPSAKDEADDDDEQEDNASQNDADDEQELDAEDDSLATDEEEEEVEEPKAKPKNRFQERINELTAKAREKERENEQLRIRLEETLARLDKKPEENTPKPVAQTQTNDGAPTPVDMNEDGSEKYPLGEFDPQFIRDLTRFTIKQETEAAARAQEEARKEQELAAQKQELINQWEEKLTVARERYEDLDVKNSTLESTFRNLDPVYGEYLASTIMGMDYGTDVLYYLGDNIEEAKRIVASGPAKATIALGRLEAKFALLDEEKRADKKFKASKAPMPPARTNKGTSVAVEISDDTDDLDLFSSKFFATKPGRRRG